jgi:hypothetical protein
MLGLALSLYDSFYSLALLLSRYREEEEEEEEGWLGSQRTAVMETNE